MRSNFFHLVCISLIKQDVGEIYDDTQEIYDDIQCCNGVGDRSASERPFFYFLSVTVCYGSGLPKAPVTLGVSIYLGYWCVYTVLQLHYT